MNNDERDTAIKETHEAVMNINANLAVLTENVRRHDKTLYDQPHGLCARLQSIESKQASCLEGRNANSKVKLAMITAFGALFGGGVTSVISAIVSKFTN